MRTSARSNSSSSVLASGSITAAIGALTLFSKPISQDAVVVKVTAISTPGSLGAFLRIAHMMAIAVAPMASVGQ